MKCGYIVPWSYISFEIYKILIHDVIFELKVIPSTNNHIQ